MSGVFPSFIFGSLPFTRNIYFIIFFFHHFFELFFNDSCSSFHRSLLSILIFFNLPPDCLPQTTRLCQRRSHQQEANVEWPLAASFTISPCTRTCLCRDSFHEILNNCRRNSCTVPALAFSSWDAHTLSSIRSLSIHNIRHKLL